MKTKLFAASLVFCSLAWSQNTSAEPSSDVTKVIHVRGNAEALAHMAGIPSTMVRGNSQLRAVVVSGKPSDVAKVAQTINELDTASATMSSGNDIELVVYVVNGSMEPIPGLAENGSELLAPVYKQLRAIFPYKNYQLLDTMLMRSGQNSGANASGAMRTYQDNRELNMPTSYHIEYHSATVSADATPSIRLEDFKFEAKVPFVSGSLDLKTKGDSLPYATTQYQQLPIGIETNVDLREGQKVVVGTANPTMFLVLTARVVQ